ncbi:hypothetical protein PsorP6_012448 [Peronosclerospora sorghi]|uniref:Uncharacterized protein n=1 Tax=Peronosclerospora sorghi TaxID=230839 RepID=A0ACC0WJD2_9STRA|nr:hypothetical protein PsorP6_012448 [Peronosclerospora sorghi]
MQDFDSDLSHLNTFYSVHNDEWIDDLWALAATSVVCHEDDLLDMKELQQTSPLKEHVCPAHKQVIHASAKERELSMDSNVETRIYASERKVNGTPTATLPARFALLSTKCVDEPGFTTSPRGKRRHSQVCTIPTLDFQAIEKREPRPACDKDGERDAGQEDAPFRLSDPESSGFPVFTESELMAMVESPSKLSTTSTASATFSPLAQVGPEATPYGIGKSPNAESRGPDARKPAHELSNVVDMLDLIDESSQTSKHESLDFTECATCPPVVAASESSYATESVLPIDATIVPPAFTAPTASYAIPYDLLSPSGYAAAAHQFVNSYGQRIQPLVFPPEGFTHAALFPRPHVEPTAAANVELAAAVARANFAAIETILKMKTRSSGPIVSESGSMPRATQVKPATPLKPRPSIQRAVSLTRGKGRRLTFTPDIADFKLVQIFHTFCDPSAKVLTVPRFQQMLLQHQMKEESGNHSDVRLTAAAEAQTVFTALNVRALTVEHFMTSFQICNRCTENKRRATEALCASQGQSVTSTALERQLMEDVAPVIVRVVPTRFEGHKVKSCDHYQWTWCEGFDKTGNAKCRGTNRHDKCPKYLANCTLWKHKLPPKRRHAKVMVLDHVDSPTKKRKQGS